MGFILSVIGTLLLLLSVGGIVFGVFMATDPKTREPGRLCALWWVPAVAAASGVLMRDAVTFAVGLICFVVAGAVFTFEGGGTQRSSVKRRAGTPRGAGSLDGTRAGFEDTTKEDKPGGYGKAAS